MNGFRAGVGSLVCGSRSSRDGNEVSGFSTLYTAAAEGRREEALEGEHEKPWGSHLMEGPATVK